MSVFGVDLGCLYSCVAITRNGGVDVVINEVSKRETPTYVSLTDQERCIGETGFDRAVRNLNNTVACVKHWIGMTADDEEFSSEKRFLFCPTTTDEKGRVKFTLNYDGESREFYPEQILAMFFHKLRTFVNRECTVDKRFPADVKDCVVTVPSWYNADQRRCVQQACEIAGINCLSLLNEATAVAVDYGIFRGSSLPEKEEEANLVVIVDIGYGHTSVNICRFWKGNVKIVSRTHDRTVSTRELDYALFQHFVKEIQKKYKIDVNENKRARCRVLQACDKLKQMLSANRTAPLNIENLMDVDVSFNSFSREEFEEIIAPVVDRYKVLLQKAFENGDIKPDQVHAIEMIGGGCRIPCLKAATQEACNGRAPSFTVNATESCARGAAITAAMFSPKFQVREFVVNDIPLLPVLGGHQNPGCDKEPSVPFLPGVNDVVCLLGAKDGYPKVLDVTVKRPDEFTFHVFYDSKAPDAQSVSHNNYHIGEWKIGAPSKEGTDGAVKIRVRILPSGLVTVESAITHILSEVEVTEEKKDPEHPDKTPEKVTTKKQKKERLELTTTPAWVLGHSAEHVVEMRKQEADMVARDDLILRTKEAKNDLEAYICNNRQRLEKGGAFAAYVSDSDRKTFLDLANTYETWLYEDGSDSVLEEYTSRLKKLEAIGDPAKRRHQIHDDAGFELKQFTDRVRAIQQKLASKQANKPAHITDEEFATANNACEDAIKFGDNGIATLRAQVKHEDPKFTFDKFGEKLKEVTNAVNAVINKPAPKPKEEAPPAPPAGQQQPQQQQQQAPGAEGDKSPQQQQQQGGAQQQQQQQPPAGGEAQMDVD